MYCRFSYWAPDPHIHAILLRHRLHREHEQPWEQPNWSRTLHHHFVRHPPSTTFQIVGVSGSMLTSSYVPDSSSGKDPICTVIQECANTSASFAFGYYSFQLYYLKSQKQYVCVSYANSNTDPSYFNVANADVTAAYGFSGMPVYVPWTG